MPDLNHHKLKSTSDASWVEEYISKMGEKEFWKYRDRIYSRLENLKPGEEFEIEKKVIPENYDLFIKIACCFITETPFRCRFNEDCTLFRRCLVD